MTQVRTVSIWCFLSSLLDCFNLLFLLYHPWNPFILIVLNQHRKAVRSTPIPCMYNSVFGATCTEDIFKIFYSFEY